MKTITKEAKGFVKNIVTYLRRDNRMKSTAPKVSRLLNKISQAAKQANLANVESAVALNLPEKRRIQEIMSQAIGHNVEISNTVNKKLLGGLRISVGDWIIDSSLLNQLTELGTSILV